VTPTCSNNCATPQLFPRTIDNRPSLSHIAFRIGTYADFRQSMFSAFRSARSFSCPGRTGKPMTPASPSSKARPSWETSSLFTRNSMPRSLAANGHVAGERDGAGAPVGLSSRAGHRGRIRCGVRVSVAPPR